jgi:hypothetical protein
MYNLEVTCYKSDNGVLICRLKIVEVAKKEKVCHIKLRYKVINGKITTMEPSTALKRRWKGMAVGGLGAGLLSFFLKTRHVFSEEWTSFWYLQKGKSDSLEYRMYDCNELFLRLNAKAHGGKI